MSHEVMICKKVQFITCRCPIKANAPPRNRRRNKLKCPPGKHKKKTYVIPRAMTASVGCQTGLRFVLYGMC